MSGEQEIAAAAHIYAIKSSISSIHKWEAEIKLGSATDKEFKPYDPFNDLKQVILADLNLGQ